MKLIVAVDQNWAIGNQGRLLTHLPEDLLHFKKQTLGHIVVMGRKTLETLPNGLPLKGRDNIILTRNQSFTCENATVVHDINGLLTLLKSYRGREIFIIGGGSIYEALLPMCNEAIITKIDAAFDADTWLPNLDKMSAWKLVDQSELRDYQGITFRYCTYINN